MNAAQAKELSLNSVPARREKVIEDMYETIRFVGQKGLSSVTFTLCKAEFSSFSSRFKLHYVPTDQESIDYIRDHFIQLGYSVWEHDQNNERQSVCIHIDWSN